MARLSRTGGHGRAGGGRGSPGGWSPWQLAGGYRVPAVRRRIYTGWRRIAEQTRQLLSGPRSQGADSDGRSLRLQDQVVNNDDGLLDQTVERGNLADAPQLAPRSNESSAGQPVRSTRGPGFRS